jgi:hypothetical protein
VTTGGHAAVRSALALTVASALVAVGTVPAYGETQLGQLPNFDPNGDCAPGSHMAQSALSSGTPYQVPQGGGVITSWRIRAHDTSPGSVRLQVWRPLGGSSYTLAGRSALEAPTAGVVNQFDTRIPVTGGEWLGRRNELGPTGGLPLGCSFTGTFTPEGAANSINFEFASPDPGPGETRSLVDVGIGSRTNVAAVLEADADCDGFGDETQDGTIDPHGCDETPPETSITKRPKKKTRRKRATFAFTSSEPGSTFECNLDGKVFRCASPLTVKVRRGKHSFRVQATDLAVNVDQTPATHGWKVRKKRKR